MLLFTHFGNFLLCMHSIDFYFLLSTSGFKFDVMFELNAPISI